jgi:hypothetical protein
MFPILPIGKIIELISWLAAHWSDFAALFKMISGLFPTPKPA